MKFVGANGVAGKGACAETSIGFAKSRLVKPEIGFGLSVVNTAYEKQKLKDGSKNFAYIMAVRNHATKK